MTVTEFLQFVDNLMFTKTDKHLDDLQKRIIEGLFRGETYQQIADNYGYDEGYIGDLSRNLFKKLSQHLGEKISKQNFCWTIERAINSQFFGLVNGNVNCSVKSPQTNTSKHPQSEEKNTEKISYHDLKLAPQIIKFYDRESELKQLENWVLNQNIKLISVLGLSGIGKTYLVKKFVDLNLDQFDVIIWRSLKFPKSLELLINDLLDICKQEIKETLDDKLKQLFDIFIEKKCLIILDDVQNIFISGEFSGQYQSEYQDYSNFFKMMTEVNHQSNLILISQEKCQEMFCLDEELYPVKCLELEGLYNNQILQKLGLKDQESWSNLINLYEGNPVYLQDIAIIINNIYDGKVADFLAENSGTGILPDKNSGTGILPVVTNNMRSHFNELFKKISTIEKQLVVELSKLEQPISREELRQNLDLSSPDLINGLQSLQQRFLVTKIKGDKILFNLSPIFSEYVRNLYKD